MASILQSHIRYNRKRSSPCRADGEQSIDRDRKWLQPQQSVTTHQICSLHKWKILINICAPLEKWARKKDQSFIVFHFIEVVSFSIFIINVSHRSCCYTTGCHFSTSSDLCLIPVLQVEGKNRYLRIILWSSRISKEIKFLVNWLKYNWEMSWSSMLLWAPINFRYKSSVPF